MLHLLQDRVLGTLQVLDQNVLAFLSALHPIHFLHELIVLLLEQLVFFSDSHGLIRLFFLDGVNVALDPRRGPLRVHHLVAARPMRELLRIGLGHHHCDWLAIQHRPQLLVLLL